LKDPENFGAEGEEAVREAVEELIKEDPRFIGHIGARSSDRLDAEGIDRMVFVRGGFVLPIQVKTTRKGIKRFSQIHPLVRFVLFIKKKRRGKSTLDNKSNPVLYRSTLNYIKKKVKDFVRRATRDAIKDFADPASKT